MRLHREIGEYRPVADKRHIEGIDRPPFGMDEVPEAGGICAQRSLPHSGGIGVDRQNG